MVLLLEILYLVYRNQIDYTIKSLTSEHLCKIKNFGIISGSTEDRLRQLKFYLNL